MTYLFCLVDLHSLFRKTLTRLPYQGYASMHSNMTTLWIAEISWGYCGFSSCSYSTPRLLPGATYVHHEVDGKTCSVNHLDWASGQESATISAEHLPFAHGKFGTALTESITCLCIDFSLWLRKKKAPTLKPPLCICPKCLLPCVFHYSIFAFSY